MAAKRQTATPPFGARFFRAFLAGCGIAFLCALLGAVLGLPWPVYNWLNNVGGEPQGTPDYIVMMGGGGIPSESGLTRTWQTAREAARYPKARVIVAMPYEPGESATNRSLVQQELMLRGVSEQRLNQEGQGRHSHEQAVLVKKMLTGHEETARLLIVTSPEHVRRSVLSFRKVGFAHVRGRGALNQDLKADLSYGAMEAEIFSSAKPSLIGGSMMIRYRIWDNLILEVKVMRELAGLIYYKINGWI